MKTYFAISFCLTLSSGVMADTSTNILLNQASLTKSNQLENTAHIFYPETSAFTLSATTGLMAPTAHHLMSQTQQRLAHVQAKVSTSGMFFDLQNQRAAYKNLLKTHDISGKARLIEKIGDQGARVYAQQLGYKPLYQGSPGQGRGFDQVYRQGKHIIVIEAKGGGSRLGNYYQGLQQGTADYTLKVAHNTLHSRTASPAAKRAARAVIQAYKTKRLVIKVARTKHVAGQPKQTVVETLYGETPTYSNLNAISQVSLQAGLMGVIIGGGLELFSSVATAQTIDWERVGGMGLLGGASSYTGTFTGAIIQQTLVNNHSQLLVTLLPTKISAPLLGGASGGVIAGAVFSYGAYFLGYSDLKTANRNMTAASLGAAAGALGSAATFGLVATFGAASTGTAIASLSGAAATNATLAWIGGGTLAAGGGGVAAGATILTGGTALIAIGVGAGVMYLYNAGDETTERERVNYLLTQVQNHLKTP